MVQDATRAFKEFERAGWEEVATGYAEFTEPVNTELTAAVLDAAQAGPGVRLLDVASGPGWVTGGADDRGADAVGVDFALSMVEQARRRCPGVEFRQGEADVVLSVELENGPADILRTLEQGAVRSRALLMAQTPQARARGTFPTWNNPTTSTCSSPNGVPPW